MAAATASFAASPIHPSEDGATVAVRSGDLDLTRRDQATVMLRRLERAASIVCGGAPSQVDLDETAGYRECLHATLDGAIARVDAPLVTALYRSQPDLTAVASLSGQ
ncbi:MAG TPA: UrcA family protein [Caulobacteraceae bacterium]|nr:UrcA family protein [Caulobacteraceae bacterium]